MNVSAALNGLADKVGILPEFYDLSGHKQIASPDTLKSLLRANGFTLDNDAMIIEALAELQYLENRRSYPTEIIVESNQPLTLNFGAGAEWKLTFEGKDTVGLTGSPDVQISLPPLISGLHVLEIENRGEWEAVNLIAAPRTLPMISEKANGSRVWGVNLALYGLVSKRNIGLGDYEDLARVGETIGDLGADFVGLNPIHALGWNNGDTISPYSPSHRGFLNTSHIAPDQIAGGQNYRNDDSYSGLIDYNAHAHRQHDILEKLYRLFENEPDSTALNRFESFCAERGQALAEFALYESISEEHGPDWRNWSAPLRLKESGAIVNAKQRYARRIRFHSWLQYVAHEQLETARLQSGKSGMTLGLYMDLAVGSRRSGAESWCDNTAVAQGVSLGAPPDHLNPTGQNWDLAAFAPRKLSASRYGPWRRAIAVAMRYSGVLRIDHVLGLNRSFWIPDDGNPGAYIRQPFEAFLSLIAIEAERSNSVVIGEDLGLVPDGFRETMKARGFYGYSVLQYEKTDEGHFRGYQNLRSQSLACFGTHDTPTLKGFITGCDIGWWQKLGWIGEAEAQGKKHWRDTEVNELSHKDPDSVVAGCDDVNASIHTSLATSPAAMVSVQLDDVFSRTEAQNLPGTIDEHPNWRRRCPVLVEDFSTNPELQKIKQFFVTDSKA